MTPTRPVNKNKIRLNGILIVALFMLLLGLALISTLFRIQIVQGNAYQKQAGENHYAKIPTYPERGKIEDANGETLALTTYVYTIGITPRSVRSELEETDKRPGREEIMQSFSQFLGLDQETLAEAFAKNDAPYVPLVKKMTKERYDPFKQYLEEYRITGVAIDSEPKRYYPKGDIASQVVGFANLGRENLFGVTGIEAYYDRELAGTPGYIYGEVDHYFAGQLPYSDPTIKKPVPGNNIVLNIDSKLQEQAQQIASKYSKLFSATDGAVALVMNARTGAIVAMAQDHSFDLNKPYAALPDLKEGARAHFDNLLRQRGIDPAYLAELAEAEEEKKLEQLLVSEKLDPHQVVQGPPVPRKFIAYLESIRQREEAEKAKQKDRDPNYVYQGWDPFNDPDDLDYLGSRIWQNRNVSYTYEPGSTMKSFTVATALEEHAFQLNEQFSDAPIWIRGFGDYAIHCHVFPNNHAYETAEQALWNSCNPIMVQLAQRVGISKFYQYVHSLGFYKLTGIDAPAEARGLLHENPTEVDLAPMSFGESNTITPISLATAYTSLGNGGVMMKPRLAKYMTDNEGKVVREFAPEAVRQVYSRETAETLLSMLRGTFVHGLVNLANEPGYFAGGKSGTSTKSTTGGEEQDYSVMSVASIFPVDDPQYVVLAIIFDPNTSKSSCAQSMCRDLIRATGRTMNVPKRYTDHDLAQLLKPKEISYANGITLPSIADYLALHNVEYEMQEGMTYDDYFYTLYPVGKVKLHGYPVYYVSKDGEPPREKVDVPDFTGKTFEEAAELAYQKRINIRYDGNPLTGVVIGQSVAAQVDEVPQQIQKYGIIELTFGQLEGYNPPNIRKVAEPVTEQASTLPPKIDPLAKQQFIYSPYGEIPEHNPYGG